MVGASTEKKRDALAVNRDRAKQMRRTPVSTEKLFWSEMRNRKLGGFKFKRQVFSGAAVSFDSSELAPYDASRNGWHFRREAHLPPRPYTSIPRGRDPLGNKRREGATAPETLRQKDREGYEHLESEIAESGLHRKG